MRHIMISALTALTLATSVVTMPVQAQESAPVYYWYLEDEQGEVNYYDDLPMLSLNGDYVVECVHGVVTGQRDDGEWDGIILSDSLDGVGCYIAYSDLTCPEIGAVYETIMLITPHEGMDLDDIVVRMDHRIK